MCFYISVHFRAENSMYIPIVPKRSLGFVHLKVYIYVICSSCPYRIIYRNGPSVCLSVCRSAVPTTMVPTMRSLVAGRIADRSASCYDRAHDKAVGKRRRLLSTRCVTKRQEIASCPRLVIGRYVEYKIQRLYDFVAQFGSEDTILSRAGVHHSNSRTSVCVCVSNRK